MIDILDLLNTLSELAYLVDFGDEEGFGTITYKYNCKNHLIIYDQQLTGGYCERYFPMVNKIQIQHTMLKGKMYFVIKIFYDKTDWKVFVSETLPSDEDIYMAKGCPYRSEGRYHKHNRKLRRSENNE